MAGAPTQYSTSETSEPPRNDGKTIRPSSFRNSFEGHVNDDMGGPSKLDSKEKVAFEIDVDEYRVEKDKKFDNPPRFSTLFTTSATPLPAPIPQVREFESRPRPKSGISLPVPVFWALLAFLLLETAILFAYTTIGLLSNLHIHVVAEGCEVAQPIINISPNFMVPQGSQQIEVTTNILSASTSSTLFASSSSSSATPSAAAAAGAILSQLAGLAHLSSSSSTPATTVTVAPTPTQSVVSSTTIVTVDPSGNSVAPRPTSTSTIVIGASEATAASTATNA